MLITDYDFALPESLIAQKPPAERQSSRMLVVNRAENLQRDDVFSNFPDLLTENDVLVLNNTKVFPARLIGEKETTGAKIELFLVREISDQIWETLARPTRRLPNGAKVVFGDKLAAEILEKTVDGHCVVKFEAGGDFHEILDEIGQTPLPPYIKREKDDAENPLDRDRERYQTVFAKNRGAIAAPTAGLHFTPEILAKIEQNGVKIVEITLHVGYGTFEPVRVAELAEHKVSPEHYEISAAAAAVLNRAKTTNKRIIAVGTTTTRALETELSKNESFTAGIKTADLTITPGYQFKAVDALLTNFHLPQSSLLVLTATFGGSELILNAYRHAVAEKYRFYSYGDCMFIN